MKPKPRWMKTVIESAKAEVAAMPRMRLSASRAICVPKACEPANA